ncbi:hypothetical protein UlMin_008428 [Ulmus minor]
MRWERLQLGSRQDGGGGGGGGGAHQRQEEAGEIYGPGKRWGHTCNAIKGGRFLYVFGGYGRDNCQTNQVHVFDTETQKWSQPVIKGTPPVPRDSHSCTTVGDNLFVFGGTDGMSPLKDLHILDTSSHTWICPTLRGEGPEAREGHDAALVGKRVFIFGGCGKSSSNNVEEYYNDLYILNTETFVWKRAISSGPPPSPRDSHSCSSWKNNIIVIGGEDGHDYYLSDVHILDTDTLIWRELHTTGQLLTPRAGHSTVAFGRRLFVFGGFTDAQNLYNDVYMLEIDSGVWTKVASVGDGPCARFSVSGACLDPQKQGVLVFFGGCNRSLEALDDIYYFHTGLSRENEQRLEKLSLRKQLKIKCQEQNLTLSHNQSLVTVGSGSTMFEPITAPIYGQSYLHNMSLMQPQFLQGKKMFHAKVTERLSDGYAIETVVDGKPLRGVVFSSMQGNYLKATPSSNRKRTAAESGSNVSNGDHNSGSKSRRVPKQDAVDQTQGGDVLRKESTSHELKKEDTSAVDQRRVVELHRKESTSHEPQTEGIIAAVSQDQAASGASQPHEVANPKMVVTTLTLGDEPPNTALKLNSDVSGEGMTNDAQNGNSKVPKENLSVRADNTDALSIKRDDMTVTSGHTEATSSIQTDQVTFKGY